MAATDLALMSLSETQLHVCLGCLKSIRELLEVKSVLGCAASVLQSPSGPPQPHFLHRAGAIRLHGIDVCRVHKHKHHVQLF